MTGGADEIKDACEQVDSAADPAADEAQSSEAGSVEILPSRLGNVLESLLFAADRPLTIKQMQELVGERDAARIAAALSELTSHYSTRGLRITEIAGGYQLHTATENGVWVQKLLGKKPVRLSRAQLETLSIVSYRQPITRAEIEQVRGVDSGAVLRMLLDRDLLRILGKKEEPGRPLLYGTTKNFLEFFQLKDLGDLPRLSDVAELSEEHRSELASGAEPKEEPPSLSISELPALDPIEEEALLGALSQAERLAEQASAPIERPRSEKSEPTEQAASPDQPGAG